MRFVLIALIVCFATGDGKADSSRADKIAYIVETQNFRIQIYGYLEEMMKRSIKELEAASNAKLSEKDKNLVMEVNASILDDVVDDYVKEVVELHSEHLTDEEIDAMYEFYLTPGGKSLGSKLPEIQRKTFWIDARYLELISQRAVSRLEGRLSQ